MITKAGIEPTTLFYRKFGSGPAIVLLHGFPATGDLWHNIWEELSISFTVIVPDLPGSGNSELNGAKGMDDMAQMINEILDTEVIGKAVLAGHSMGGYVALSFAGLYPGKVAGLSLVHSTTEADDEEKKKTRRRAIELIQNGGKIIFISQMIPNLFSSAFKQSDPETVKRQIERSSEMEDKSLINFYQAMIDRQDSTGVIAKSGFPVQWIAGLYDTIIPYKKILTKCHDSDINFVSFYNNCGHMSMIEAPGSLAADLKEFVTYCYLTYES